MKRLITTACLIFFAMPTLAKEPIQGQNRWSLGFDFMSTWARPNGPDWGAVIHEQHNCGDIYIANRFANNWSAEFGYWWTDRKPKTFWLNAGDQAFGATSSGRISHTGKIRLSQTYLDFYGYMRFTKNVEGMAGPGIGWVNSKFQFFHSPDNSSDPVTSAMDSIGGRTDVVFRFNIGFQALWTKRVGIRMLFNYTTLNNVRARNVDINAVDRHYVNNSYGVAIGMFWTFLGRDDNHVD